MSEEMTVTPSNGKTISKLEPEVVEKKARNVKEVLEIMGELYETHSLYYVSRYETILDMDNIAILDIALYFREYRLMTIYAIKRTTDEEDFV